jgi:hypothetical protein
VNSLITFLNGEIATEYAWILSIQINLQADILLIMTLQLLEIAILKFCYDTQS